MPFSRRRFLAATAGLAGSGGIPRLAAGPRFERDPFTLGVASGYPTPDGIVLWTRLAPDPLAGGGMPPAPVAVGWEVATDEGFRNIVQRGTASADPDWAHSVHAEIRGLAPARDWFYRFHAGDATSPTGRTRIAPAASVEPRLRIALASCQHYEQGYYVAYRHMAREDLDLVCHVGDYIYESSWGRAHVRQHEAGEPEALDEYRNRYALYKSDAELRAAHAAFPWIVTWDDHEVQNDYANDRGPRLDPPAQFLRRRAAAYRAFYEHMPLPARMRPLGPDMRIYTRAPFGAIATLHVLDDRQYRAYQVCPRPGRGGSNVVLAAECPELQDSTRTLLGAEQERWLDEGLRASRTRWNVIVQQTMMAQVDRRRGDGQSFWTDGWDGYPKARDRLLASLVASGAANPVVLGGDIHTFVAADLRMDFNDTAAPPVATEFVGGSITSQGPTARQLEVWRAENPHIRYANSSRHGYTVLDFAAGRCVARMRAVDSVADPGSVIRTIAAWTVESGRPGAQRDA